MKNGILLLVAGLFSTMLLAQSQSNALTKAEFYKTKFDNFSFAELSETKAEEHKVIKLLDIPRRIMQGDGGIGDDWKRFVFPSGLTVGYMDLASDDFAPSVSYIKASSITVYGITANVGDDVAVFGETVTVTDNGDTKTIKIIIDQEECCPVVITVNKETNAIEKIEYKVESSAISGN